MWHREYVNWQQRRLLGRPESGKGDEVDFADQSAIYGLYAANHDCIYIGQAGRGNSGLFDRLKTHALEDHLFCFWVRFTWLGFYSSSQLRKGRFDDPVTGALSLVDALDTIESVGVYLALPRFNRRYGSGFGGVEWYYQNAEYERLRNAQA
ncbi:hypothetical protein GF380_01070 [Candidatus Uhrbacteria bacterium]|nr:hypothetical protein [Candidatus Uhrbacteria bacterium]